MAIPVKNIYHMLSYAWHKLRHGDYARLGHEDFTHLHDLFAAIVDCGLSGLLRRGLYRAYHERRETLPLLRGRLDMPATLAERRARRLRLGCAYDELTENTLLNRICVTAAHILARHGEVREETRQRLQRLLPRLTGIEPLSPAAIPWQTMQLHRGNASYATLLHICRLFFASCLPTRDGTVRLAEFLDDQRMHELYQNFLLAYFAHEHGPGNADGARLDAVHAPYVAWHLDPSTPPDAFLPTMHTDVVLRKGERTLIIDAKYYGRSMATHHDQRRLHSAHLYQIYAYVKNHDREKRGATEGMLLYAGTDEAVTPDSRYSMDGNVISARTLDLNRDFAAIREDLDAIANSLNQPPSQHGQ